ncbi:MAG: phosphoglucosamine mutase [Clostridiales bacterium]|jgi:phosphoglucosamine mutase|nr:phosphoglucosamine mutase [Clostridiales bacterium]
MSRLFGTDGVRGVANKDLTAALAYKLGRCGAWLLSDKKFDNPKIVVGKDTRISCDMLESALIAGICSTGVDVVCLGVIPTPAVAYLTRFYDAIAGVVISASHNSFEFNGIKFFNSQGFKLPDEIEDDIERLVYGDQSGIENPLGDKIGRKYIADTAKKDYIDFLSQTISGDLKGLNIVLDCANGASSFVTPELFRNLKAEVSVINCDPDGTNINKKCGSTHMDMLKEAVVEARADMGFAFDGDADRMLAVDEKGNCIDGDAIMAILALALKKSGKLAHSTITVTVMSNMGLDIMAEKNDIKLVKTTVGDKYVLEEMLRSGYVIGGENSGHIILLEYNTTGDGALTAIQLAKTAKDSEKTLSELASVFNPLPLVLRGALVKEELKYSYLEDPDISEMCRELEAEFNGTEGRVLIRPSGTEPLIRIMIEGKDEEYITSRAEQLVRLVERRLNLA